MKKIYLFIISLTFFSFLIFFIGNYFFGSSENKMNEYIENTYIDPNVELLPLKKKIIDKTIKKDNEYLDEKEEILDFESSKEKIKTALKSAYNINFSYFPNELEYSIIEYSNAFKVFLNNKNIINKIDKLKVEFYDKKDDVRGKMKNNSIKLFGIKKMEEDECNAVGIHEFGHYIDLYFLKKELFTDLSDYYYNISWKSTKVMKPGLVQADFVSGYAMTNKYEDFAESFTYFVLHNNDFLEKAKKSNVLKNKYNFFTKYLFREKTFIGSDFSLDNKVELYYRDITKINFSLKNFLEFLKK